MKLSLAHTSRRTAPVPATFIARPTRVSRGPPLPKIMQGLVAPILPSSVAAVQTKSRARAHEQCLTRGEEMTIHAQPHTPRDQV